MCKSGGPVTVKTREAMFEWSFIPAMTASIGALVGAGSLAWGLWSYRMTKRHEYITGLRQTVSDCMATCERIRLLLPYDLAHEITSNVVYSRVMAFVFKELCTRFCMCPVKCVNRLVQFRLLCLLSQPSIPAARLPFPRASPASLTIRR